MHGNTCTRTIFVRIMHGIQFNWFSTRWQVRTWGRRMSAHRVQYVRLATQVSQLLRNNNFKKKNCFARAKTTKISVQ